MKKIRVLHMLREMEIGGIQSLLMNIYRNINKEEIQFDFLVNSKGFYDDEIRQMGGKIYYIPHITEVGPIKYKKNLDTFFKENNQYKILHLHFDQLSGLIAEQAKKNNIPIIIAHSHIISASTNLIGKLYKKTLQRKINKYPTHYFACSNKAAKYLFNRKIEQVEILKNGIEIDKFKFDNEKRINIRKELGIDSNTLLIGHTGRIVKEKNHKFIIEVFKELLKLNKNIKLLIIGDGPDKNKIQKKVKSMKIEKNVIFIKSTPNVSDYYNAMDLFLFPSLYEGLGISLIEAQVNGLVCFTSDTVPNETNITGKVNFLGLKRGPKEWAKYINESDYNRYNFDEKISKSGYNIKNTTTILEKFYKNNYEKALKNEKIKVLQYIPAFNYGGIETFALGINNELKDKYHFTYLVEVKLSKENENKIRSMNSDVITIPNMTKDGFLKNLFAINKVLKENKYDIIHVHDADIRCFLMLLAKIKKIKKRIYHIHSIKIEGSVFASIIKRIGISINMFCANNILACSQEAAKCKCKKDNVVVIKNAIEIDKYKFNLQIRKNIREQLKIEDKDILLLFVGRLSKIKNVSFIFKVLKQCNDPRYKLLIIGDGEEKNNLIEKTKEMDIDKRVIFLGKKDDPIPYYSAADILCLPSIREGLSFVLIEAQANGLKCIASSRVPKEVNVTNTIKFIEIEEKNIQEWSNCIQNMNIDRYVKVEELIKAGYDRKSSINNLDVIYEKGEKSENIK